uniref:Uncharacterized protein n=1 Tax=Manihot esculenta TaxID=3983 RepID=A0A2C9W3D2_MANES
MNKNQCRLHQASIRSSALCYVFLEMKEKENNFVIKKKKEKILNLI